MRLGKDIKGRGAGEFKEEFNSEMDEGWVENEVPKMKEAGRGYLSPPKEESQGWG